MERKAKITDVLKLITIDENSRKPKYLQLVDSISYHISAGNLEINQQIPSINKVSEEFYLSKDTVSKAYKILKERNIIKATNRIGYYVNKTKFASKVNVLFLVNKLSSYKMRIYNSFIHTMGANAVTELYVYHCDELLFLNSLKKNSATFDYYIIMPHFKTGDLKHVTYTKEVVKALSQIPKQRLLLLDNGKNEIDGSIGEVYQDFENDIYFALKEGLSKIATYKKIILVYPEEAVYPYPRRILHGFKKFCLEHALNFEVIDQVYENILLERGDLFITIEEEDLVNLVKQIREDEFVLGEDLGVISYNDTPLKELLGITTISADFKAMGEKAANVILNNEVGSFKVPFRFIERNSI